MAREGIVTRSAELASHKRIPPPHAADVRSRLDRIKAAGSLRVDAAAGF
jgi:hypothetical protein